MKNSRVVQARNPGAIREMFDHIAPRYDLLNRLLSLGQDRCWRRRTAGRVLAAALPGPVLDLACGTGDLLVELSRRAPRRCLGADVAPRMLAQAREKIDRHGPETAGLIRADGRCLPVADGTLAAITIAFGLRNFPDLDEALAEFKRALMPGGVLGILEFTRDRRWWIDPPYRFWARWVMPPIGGWLSRHPTAYRYLPASVDGYAEAARVRSALEQAGFELLADLPFTGGICRLQMARALSRSQPEARRV